MPIAARRITSAAEMRALAHPVRLRLLDLLGSEGAFTASEAGRRLDETPANVSWHLRQLAKHGFVRQSEGPGRARPWRYVAQSLMFGDDAEDSTLSTALTDILYDRELQVLRASMRNQEKEDVRWRDATSVVQSRLWMTHEEAERLGTALEALLLKAGYLERNQDPSRRPSGARLMALMGWVVPYGPAPEPAGALAASADPARTTDAETGE